VTPAGHRPPDRPRGRIAELGRTAGVGARSASTAAARPLLLAAMKLWRASASAELNSVPRPRDSPYAAAPGPDPDRVLLIGSGPAVGWGVSTHQLALPGQLARELSRGTGRGTHVDVIADPNMTVESAAASVPPSLAAGYDAIIVTVGVNDALSLTTPSKWRDAMTQLVHDLRTRSTASTQLVITGIQPIRSIPVYDSVFGLIAERHATVLNGISREIGERSRNTSFVRLDAWQQGNDRHRSPIVYRNWGRALAAQLMATDGFR